MSQREARQASVLFVCMGNICRSPAAENLFRDFVEKRGVAERVHIDSAGTIDYHEGEPPDARMRQAAERRGYELRGKARPIRRADLDRFDLIVVMDRENLRDVRALGESPEAVSHVRLLSDFLPDGWEVDVPDPYFGGAQGFEHVLDMIEAACPALLEEVIGDAGAKR